MKRRDLLGKLDNLVVVVLKQDDLSELLESADTVREEKTCIAGSIRVLCFEGRVVVQEQVQASNEIVVRKFASRGEAEQFVDTRLETYERMWDGCGCKINYFS